MKLNLKKLSAKADNDVFDEIIGKCEQKMASPFKKEVAAVEVEPSEDEEMEVAETEKSDISEEDLQKLLELYQQMKG